MPNQKPLDFKTIRTIHIALGIGVFLFFAVTVYLSSTHEVSSYPVPELNTLISYIIGAFCIINPIAATIAFPIVINSNKKNFTDIEASRYQIFGPAHIVRVTIMEGMALFACVALILFVVSGRQLVMVKEVIIPFIALLIYYAFLIVHFPTEFKIRSALGLARSDYPQEARQ